jgi:hypothetical protein
LTTLAARGSKAIKQQAAVAKKASAASVTYTVELNESSKRFKEALNHLETTLGGLAKQADSIMHSLDANAKSFIATNQNLQDKSAALMTTMATSQESVLTGLRQSADRANQGFNGLMSIVQRSDELVRQLSSTTHSAIESVAALPKQFNAAVSNASDSLQRASQDIQRSATILNASSVQMQTSTESYSKRVATIIESLTSLADKQLAPLANKTLESLRTHAQQCSEASKALEAAAVMVLRSSQSSANTLATVEKSDRHLENAVALLAKSIEKASGLMESQLTILRTWPQTTEQMVEHAREFLDQEMKSIASQMAQIAQVFASELKKHPSRVVSDPSNGKVTELPGKK